MKLNFSVRLSFARLVTAAEMSGKYAGHERIEMRNGALGSEKSSSDTQHRARKIKTEKSAEGTGNTGAKKYPKRNE